MRNSLKWMLAGLVGTGIGLCALSASATPVTSFSILPVTDPGALTDDPQLVGRILNLMSVSVGGNDWTNSLIRIQLTAGTVYNATNAVGTESSPNAAIWTIPTLRNGPYDSFVNSKGLGATPDANPQPATILGTVNPDGSPGPAPAIGLSTNGAQLVSVQWGNTVGGETGDFSIARFTLSADAVGTFFGQSFDSSGAGQGVPFSGNIVGGVMTVPEPTAIALIGLVGFGAVTRRRRVLAA